MLNCNKIYLIEALRPVTRIRYSNFSTYNEEGRKQPALSEEIQEQIDADRKALKWRRTAAEAGYFMNKLKLFSNDHQTSDFLSTVSKPIDLSPSNLLAIWRNKKKFAARYMQQYLPERHKILGPDLATAHFILYRGGSVKFTNGPEWIKADEYGDFDLPKSFDSSYRVEALKCDNMTLYYEGMENLQSLEYLKYISFYNVQLFDDWHLDRLSGMRYPQLEILDITKTNTTYRGLSCLYRLNTLKFLIVDNPKESLAYELSCAMLQEFLPHLEIASSAEKPDLSLYNISK